MRRSRRTYVAISIGLGLTLGLLLAEMAVRVVRYGPDALLPSVMNSLHPIGTSGMLQRASDALDYELRPNLDELYKKVPFRTNSDRLRDREYALKKPENTFRVAVVGDSFTMPTGVPIEEAYHSRLEERLNEAARASGSPQRYEFLNFGVGGYQFPQYHAVIRERALPYDPDLILIGMSTNDHVYVTANAYLFDKPYEVLDVTYPFFESEIVAAVRRYFEPILQANPDEFHLHPMFREHVEDYFGRFAEVSRETGVPVVVVYLAQYRWQFAKLIDELSKIAAEKGLLFLDATAPFPDAEDLSLRIFPADGHPNGRANAVFADFLEEELLERALVPDPAGAQATRP